MANRAFGLNIETAALVNLLFVFLLGGSLVFSLNYDLITPPVKTLALQALVVSLSLIFSTLSLLKIFKHPLSYFFLSVCFYYLFFSPTSYNLGLFVTILSLNVFLNFLILPQSQAIFLSAFCFFLLTFHLFLNGLMWSDYSPYQYLVNFFTFVFYALGGLFIKSSLSDNKALSDLLSLKLKKESDLNEAIITSILSGVLTCDAKNKFRALNSKAKSVIKTHPRLLKTILEHLGKNDSAIVNSQGENNKESFSDAQGGVRSGVKGVVKKGVKSDPQGEESFNSLHSKTHGSFDFDSQNFFFRVHYSKIGSHKDSDFVILISDETQYRRHQKELENTKKLAAIGTLSAGLAHEIRNPLAGMSGSIELLKEGENSKEVQIKLFSSLLKEIDRLNLLVTDFLSFSLPSVELRDQINLKVFISQILDEFRLNPKANGIAIESELDPCPLKVDGPKLKQVFLNLFLNSVEAFDNDHTAYLEKNKLKPKITLSGRNLGQKYSLSIEDNGSGISEYNLEKIFEPFHTTKDKGTGLGLALSHGILKEHGALVQVDSQLKVGTIFKIEFKI